MINTPSEDFQDQRALQLESLLLEYGFEGMTVESNSPLRIVLPYKAANSQESRKQLTIILDSVFGDWSIATEYQGRPQYLITPLNNNTKQ
jgi:hypothetical protein